MTGKQDRHRQGWRQLKNAMLAVLTDPTDSQLGFELVRTARKVLMPEAGLIWSEVSDAVQAAYDEASDDFWADHGQAKDGSPIPTNSLWDW